MAVMVVVIVVAIISAVIMDMMVGLQARFSLADCSDMPLPIVDIENHAPSIEPFT